MTRVPVWKGKIERTPKPSNRASRFLKTHKKVITVLSAVVVFISFGAKEGLDAHFKDLADRLRSAENEYLRLWNDEDYRDAIFNTKETVERLEGLLVYQQPMDPMYKEILLWEAFNKNFFKEINYGERYLSGVDILMGALSREHAYQSRREELRARDNAMAKQFMDTSREFYPKRMPNPQFTDYSNRAEKFVQESGALTAEVYAETERKIEQSERYHKICTRGSYVLFAYGWALGLVSSLIGSGSSKTE